MEEFTGPCAWKQAIILSGVLLLERWFGRTTKTKANCTIDFVIQMAISIVAAVINKWRGKVKTLVNATQDIGGDGAKASESLVVEDSMLKLRLEVQYPVAKITEPIKKALDPVRVALEKLIPGDWENPLVDKAFNDGIDQLVKLLTE